MVPRLAFVGFNLAQPFLLLRVVSHISQGATDDDATRGLVGATALVFIGITVSSISSLDSNPVDLSRSDIIAFSSLGPSTSTCNTA